MQREIPEVFFNIKGVIGNVIPSTTSEELLNEFIKWIEDHGWEFCGGIELEFDPNELERRANAPDSEFVDAETFLK